MEIEEFTLINRSLTGTGSYVQPEIGQIIRSYDLPGVQEFYIQGIIEDVEHRGDDRITIHFEVNLDCSNNQPWTRIDQVFTLDLSSSFESIYGIGRIVIINPKISEDKPNRFYRPDNHFPSRSILPNEFVSQFHSLNDFLERTAFQTPIPIEEGEDIRPLQIALTSELNECCLIDINNRVLQQLLWDQHATQVFLTHFFWKFNPLTTK